MKVTDWSRGVYVVTVATDASKTKLLQRSCVAEGLQLVLLGLGERWTGHCMKLRLFKDWLLRTPVGDDDVVIFSDGYDTYCQHSVSEVLSRLKSFRRDTTIVSTELYLWPPSIFHLRGFFDAAYEDSPQSARGDRGPNPPYRYPCSGQYAGTKKSLIRVLEAMDFVDSDDDQGKLIECIGKHPTWFTLDHGTSLFQPNMYTMEDHSTAIVAISRNKIRRVVNEDLTLRRDGGKTVLYNVRTKSSPCFLHANAVGSSVADMIQGHLDHTETVHNFVPKATSFKCTIITHPQRRAQVDGFVRTYKLDADIALLKPHAEQTMEESLVVRDAGLSPTDLMRGLGHISALQLASHDTKSDFVLFLEDDACFSNCIEGRHPTDVLEELVRTTPRDVDVLLLGDDKVNFDCMTPVKRITPVSEDQDLCLLAYAVRGHKIGEILSSLLPLREPLQKSLAAVIESKKLRTLKARPRAFRSASETEISRTSRLFPSLHRANRALQVLGVIVGLVCLGILLFGGLSRLVHANG